MLTFFRRIRKSLLGSGAAGKYLLYAIGEIALVVLGILIALQINNWNEGKKAIKVEQKLLLSLQREISTNIAQLERRIEKHISSSEQNKELLRYFSSRGQSYNVAYLDSLVENATTPTFFNPQMGVVKSMISTGELKFIRNEIIVEYVSMFEDKSDEVMKQSDRLTIIWNEQLWPRENKYIRRLNRVQGKNWFNFELPPSPHSSDYDSLFADVVLENTFMLSLYEQISLIIREETLLEQMKAALELIKSELIQKDSSTHQG
jgi:hypothetical protein